MHPSYFKHRGTIRRLHNCISNVTTIKNTNRYLMDYFDKYIDPKSSCFDPMIYQSFQDIYVAVNDMNSDLKVILGLEENQERYAKNCDNDWEEVKQEVAFAFKIMLWIAIGALGFLGISFALACFIK